jgi:hypothetical protein
MTQLKVAEAFPAKQGLKRQEVIIGFGGVWYRPETIKEIPKD